jgi:integrase
MSARRRITEGTLRGLKPAPKGKRTYIYDAVVPQFGVMSTDKGSHSFIVYARFGTSKSPSHRTIAPVGRITLAEARAKGEEWAKAAAQGIDPAEEARKAKAAAEGRKTFGDLAEVFIARHIRKQRRAADSEREIRNWILPKLGKHPLAEITRKQVASLIGEIRDRPAPGLAHNVFGHIRRFYSWLLSQPEYEDLLAVSPCDRIRAKDLIGEKKPRQRVLSDDELRAVWAASDKMGYPWGNFYKLLLLTGCRKTEASEARWSEFGDLKAKLWTIPESRFKSDRKHIIPLSLDAVALLADMPRWTEGDFVFSTREGRIPLNSFSKAKTRLDVLVAAELGRVPEPFVIHDLRRTMRTRLSQLRVSTEVAELVIGHSLKGLHAVYNQHDFLDERREALDQWGARLRAIVTPPPENVVPMKRARA